MENNFCPFCAEETDADLSEHAHGCTEYQENKATNTCPFCCTQIDQCCVMLVSKIFSGTLNTNFKSLIQSLALVLRRVYNFFAWPDRGLERCNTHDSLAP